MVQGTLTLGDDFESLGYLEKMQAMSRSAPSWNVGVTGLSYVWWIATAITLAANRRKRAIHDFIAGTVVVRTN
jgi:hypothetical protein